MNKYKSLVERLIEAEKPTKTKDKSKTIDAEIPLSRGELSTDKKTSSTSKTAPKKRGVPGHTADKAAISGIRSVSNDDAMAAALDHIRANRPEHDDVGDFGIDEPMEPGRDVAVPNKLPVEFDRSVTWHMLKNTPMYSMFKSAFDPLFTDMLGAPCANLKVATTLRGAGTPMRMMSQLIGYLLDNGEVRDGIDQMEAFGIDPDVYSVKNAWVVELGEDAFFIMKEVHYGDEDNSIYYVYMSPGTAKGAQKKIR